MRLFTRSPRYKDTVLFVSGMSDAEYQKITKVIKTYRKANSTVNEVLGSPLDDYKLEYEYELTPGKLVRKIDKI